MAVHEKSEDERRKDWFLDSGSSNHMCGDKMWFCRIDEGYRKYVKLRNGTRMEVLGKGDVRFNLNGVTHVVTDVFYVPELNNNLLSIGQLLEKGLTIQFEGYTCKCKVYHAQKGLILECHMETNRMFLLFI